MKTSLVNGYPLTEGQKATRAAFKKRNAQVIFDFNHNRLGYAALAKKYGFSRQRAYEIVREAGNKSFKTVWKRDKWTCQQKKKCRSLLLGVTSRPLCIHHIDLNPSNNSISNLIVLCMKCHSALHAGLRRKKPTR